MSDTFALSSDGLLRCTAMERFRWQSHGFGTRQAQLAAAVTLRQIHSDQVWNASALADRQEEGDALITDAPGLAIGVRTADCVPVLLLDAERRAVAAIHAGWRGTATGIVTRTIQKMNMDFGTEPDQIHAAIGPCIQQCCYVVGEEVWRRFETLFPEWQASSAPTPGKRKLDLATSNNRQLEQAGVPPAQIFNCGLCTFCRPDLFYSFRRTPGESGRMLTVISRR